MLSWWPRISDLDVEALNGLCSTTTYNPSNPWLGISRTERSGMGTQSGMMSPSFSGSCSLMTRGHTPVRWRTHLVLMGWSGRSSSTLCRLKRWKSQPGKKKSFCFFRIHRQTFLHRSWRFPRARTLRVNGSFSLASQLWSVFRPALQYIAT